MKARLVTEALRLVQPAHPLLDGMTGHCATHVSC
jgi:hypothetical protein